MVTYTDFVHETNVIGHTAIHQTRLKFVHEHLKHGHEFWNPSFGQTLWIEHLLYICSIKRGSVSREAPSGCSIRL